MVPTFICTSGGGGLMSRFAQPALITLMLLALCGCGTICNFATAPFPMANIPNRPAVYGGVELDAAMMLAAHPGTTSKTTVFIAAILIADTPLSFVGDTLTLPLTLWLDKRKHPASPDPTPEELEKLRKAPSTALRNFDDADEGPTQRREDGPS
jgi:hypothetical protein